MSGTPIKRHPLIQPLSRDHHHALLLCWKIKTGLTKRIEPSRIKKYADWFYKNHLKPHFDLEEKYMFPILGSKNELVMQAIREHQILSGLFAETDTIKEALNKIESLLKKHIRFEERVLFNEIQLKASDEQLQTLSELHTEAKFVDNNTDMFWK